MDKMILESLGCTKGGADFIGIIVVSGYTYFNIYFLKKDLQAGSPV